MDKLAVGILAHVDAGKTTLSEALLYRGGVLRKLGRVDHADAFLDTDALERERGITIYAKQAILPLPDVELTLLDTPGHVDFSAEAERTLGVLDCAILVVSGPDGPQGHTLTLWKLLERHGVPTFLFLNKMDQPGTDKAVLLEKLRSALDPAILDWSAYGTPSFWEEAALGDEEALEEYMEGETLSDDTFRRLIGGRKCFPCLFGSALKLEGVEELLTALSRFAPRPSWGGNFAARVFKISRDPQGARLTHMKVTGGSLRVRSLLPVGEGNEKVAEIRLYSGARFTAVEEVPAGTVCAVTGLTSTYPGQALGEEDSWLPPTLEPALTYQLILPQGIDPHAVLPKLRLLAEEDPRLHLEWKEELGEIHLRLMGQVQAEVLKRLISDRFGLEVEFGPGNIVYAETIAAPVEGVGHFEPLRHYAEVHILLEPLPPGSGLQFDTVCSEDVLDRNWQRLILTHLMERSHRGVLTGSPITDMKLTLLAGKAHEKHTEGGDFRQATYRAIRQGLRKAKSILLEPWYSLRLELPQANVGRALADLQRMGGETEPPQTVGEEAVLTGGGPVSQLRDYAAEVAAYTKGRGRLTCLPGGYRPCPDQETVVAELGYDPDGDRSNPTGSIFCAHGAGYYVPWDEVEDHMHLATSQIASPVGRGLAPAAPPSPTSRRTTISGSLEEDKELKAIFEKTYGAVKPRSFEPPPKPRRTSLSDSSRTIPDRPTGPEYLLVDGYNMIFAWEELKALAREDLSAARKTLADVLSNYQGFRQNRIILVFDAYKVPQGTGSVTKYHNIHVVYTKEAETADSYIEKASYRLQKEGHNRVRVATSDGPVQFIILGHGALRLSAQDLRSEVEQAQGEISAILKRNNLALPRSPMKEAFEKAGGQNAGEDS